MLWMSTQHSPFLGILTNGVWKADLCITEQLHSHIGPIKINVKHNSFVPQYTHSLFLTLNFASYNQKDFGP